MKNSSTVTINFRGGIISPGELYDILVAAANAKVSAVSFGLRQQLLIQVLHEYLKEFSASLNQLGIQFELDDDIYPNVVSSYPAEEVFITNTWLSEGVYKDIFDSMDYRPRLKINVSDSNQSFTPLLTGNINWVASPVSVHFWHLFIRFPKTNIIYEWDKIVYTNDIGKISQQLESLIFEQSEKFYDNPKAEGKLLFEKIIHEDYIIRTAESPAKLPSFNLPYYEGMNKYNNKYWIGIYRRDELFAIDFLKDMSTLCLETKIGQLCVTPWKSIIVKGVEEKDKTEWNKLLARHQVNMRHAANELNFQVEDNCKEALQLKSYLVKNLNNNDTRTFGICFGIKTKRKTEVFSSILIKRKPLITIFGIGCFHVFDILCAKDFNPNERTGAIFRRNAPKFLLAEQLRRAVLAFYSYQANKNAVSKLLRSDNKETIIHRLEEFVYQCKHCMTIYDNETGEPENDIAAGIDFKDLPMNYACSLCASPKTDFVKKSRSSLELQAM